MWASGTQCVQNRPSRWPLSSPPRVGYIFLQYLALQGGSRNSPVWATLAQNGQKVLKKGAPPVLTSFSVRSRTARPCCRRFSKKWGISPRWTIHRGETALFSGIQQEGSLGARDLPRIVFLKGGGSPITPCRRRPKKGQNGVINIPTLVA